MHLEHRTQSTQAGSSRKPLFLVLTLTVPEGTVQVSKRGEQSILCLVGGENCIFLLVYFLSKYTLQILHCVNIIIGIPNACSFLSLSSLSLKANN